MAATTVICILSVKNEAWILKQFIECARAWADLIIIGDHHSMDNSLQLAQQYDFVKTVALPNPAYDEDVRRKILIDEARKIPGRRLILSMDADEMISANWFNSAEWDLMLTAQPGTRFYFDWVELLPGLTHGAIFGQVAAFVDDDSEYAGTRIHTSRVPTTSGETIRLQEIRLLHYILIDPQRMFSRHRWYKCWEYIENKKRPWAICVTYQDTKIKSYDAPMIPIPDAWLKGYEWLNQYRSGNRDTEKCYWWDDEVLGYFDRYGVASFRKLNIWDVDWNKKAQLLGRKGLYNDPRTSGEVWIHKFIEKHRQELKINQSLRYKALRLFAKTSLRIFGW